MKVDRQGLGDAAMLLVHAKMLAPSMFIAGTTDPFSARSSKQERLIELIPDPYECIVTHRTAAIEIHFVCVGVRLVAIVGMPAVGLERSAPTHRAPELELACLRAFSSSLEDSIRPSYVSIACRRTLQLNRLAL